MMNNVRTRCRRVGDAVMTGLIGPMRVGLRGSRWRPAVNLDGIESIDAAYQLNIQGRPETG